MPCLAAFYVVIKIRFVIFRLYQEGLVREKENHPSHG